jgi:23S rRNA pseudouridine1911/1915/1917 synthase
VNPEVRRVDITVEREIANERLDIYLARREELGLSRSHIARLIKRGLVLVNGEKPRPAMKIKAGDIVGIEIPVNEGVCFEPEPISIDVVYEDDDLMVVNKPRGMVTHPGAGVSSGTLVNALLFHSTTLSTVGGDMRPGIVHRLDKNTSGLLIVAKTDEAHRALATQLKSRNIKRVYLALVHGEPTRCEFTIDKPIGRHPVNRKKMAVLKEGGKSAITHFRVLKQYSRHALLECSLETGRTHQIRVHLSHAGYPVVGDEVYGKRKEPPEAPVWALHATRLCFFHPRTGEAMQFHATLPRDMACYMDILKRESASASRRTCKTIGQVRANGMGCGRK